MRMTKFVTRYNKTLHEPTKIIVTLISV